AMLLLPVALRSACCPVAVLLAPDMLARSALNPLAVFWLPVVLFRSARAPLAVLLLPLVLAISALDPIAVLFSPMMTFGSEISVAGTPLGTIVATRGAVAVTAMHSPDVPSALMKRMVDPGRQVPETRNWT